MKPFFSPLARQYFAFIGLIILVGYLSSLTYRHVHREWVAFAQGEEYLDKKEISKALASYEEASRLGVNTPKLYLRLAYCYSELNSYDTAIVWYERYLRERPSDTIARFRYAQALSFVGKSEEADQEFQKIEEK